MPRAPARPFRLSDALVLIAALAAGFALVREFRGWTVGWLGFARGDFTPHSSGCTSLRSPGCHRPPAPAALAGPPGSPLATAEAETRSRLLLQPGFWASGVVAMQLILAETPGIAWWLKGLARGESVDESAPDLFNLLLEWGSIPFEMRPPFSPRGWRPARGPGRSSAAPGVPSRIGSTAPVAFWDSSGSAWRSGTASDSLKPCGEPSLRRVSIPDRLDQFRFPSLFRVGPTSVGPKSFRQIGFGPTEGGPTGSEKGKRSRQSGIIRAPAVGRS